MLSQFQPFGTLFNVIVQLTKQPCGSGLRPNAFVRVDDRAIPVERREKAALFRINTVPCPKWNRILEEAVPVTEINLLMFFMADDQLYAVYPIV